ncbi:MAG: enoyl-CoA hydratase/isomerase family protein [Acidobacteriota bacterium]
MSEQRLVNYRVVDGVAHIRLDDPPANAYTHEMMLQLDAAILRARFDEDVHVIVLTGEGEKMFCAGANIETLRQMRPAYKDSFCLHANETLNRLEQTPKLVIAALNGHTVGGGLEVALAADLRVARRGGGKIGLPEVTLGVLPGTGGTQRLVRLVGKARAMEMMVSGKLVDFDTAVKWGLIHEVLDGEDFPGAVSEYASRFVPPRAAPLAVGLIKRAVQTGAEMGFAESLALERELQSRLFCTADAVEGLDANRARRPPRFTGR